MNELYNLIGRLYHQLLIEQQRTAGLEAQLAQATEQLNAFRKDKEQQVVISQQK